ncbi:MAG: UDP-glucose/GDP-mannose dehydrogenase family protein [Alphaproteobacteria bacterium]|nr:UDP-glucose/GDP-mannose dehydrogenase family protein [Alphaproteobacteria bacterium]
MELAVVGAGYVGLVVAACLADLGHDVRCIERDVRRLVALRSGRVPIFEPGLDDIVARTAGSGRLTFHDDVITAARGVEVVFVAVGTPPDHDGTADTSEVERVALAAAGTMAGDGLIVLKSTVPVGMADTLRERLSRAGHGDLDIVSNPEFLSEGRAVDDFTHPDRIVLGYAREASGARMERLYAPLVRSGQPVLHMDNRSAELAKYAANVALAARVSLMNELSRVAEAVGADIEKVRHVVGTDERIGAHFLFAGAGFGGSCFPKDLLALERLAHAKGVPLSMVPAIREVNERQQRSLVVKLAALVPGGLEGRKVAVWGLAYKAGTDDIRQAPALVLVDGLLAAGCVVHAYDPKAMDAARDRYGHDVTFCTSPMEAVRDADALVVVTEWQEFRSPDFRRVARAMRGAVVVDGRNLYEPTEVVRAGLVYAGMGRPIARPFAASGAPHPSATPPAPKENA